MPDQTEPRAQRFAQQLKKGVLEMLVLQLLAAEPAHGYQLIQRLRTQSGGLLDLKEGTLYPILYRLEDDALIASDWQQGRALVGAAPRRPVPRKVYTITPAGRAALAAERSTWDAFAACVASLCQNEKGELPQ